LERPFTALHLLGQWNKRGGVPGKGAGRQQREEDYLGPSAG
jgi:hypothetical protein